MSLVARHWLLGRVESFLVHPTGPAEMDRDEGPEGSEVDQASFEGSEAEDSAGTDDDAYAAAERDDEELLKTVFQKVSRWEQNEAAKIKVLSILETNQLWTCKQRPTNGSCAKPLWYAISCSQHVPRHCETVEYIKTPFSCTLVALLNLMVRGVCDAAA